MSEVATTMSPEHEALFRRVLDRLQADAESLFGTTQVGLDDPHVVERPFSHVLRLRVSLRGASSHLFVKRFKLLGPGLEQQTLMRDRVSGEFATSQRVHQLLSSRQGFAAVRPIICYPDDFTIVTMEAPGSTLSELLERQASWRPPPETVAALVATLRRVGAWIQTFQVAAPVDGTISLDGMRTYLDTRLQKLRRARAGFSEEDRGAILQAFDLRAAQVSPADLTAVSIHADLSPANVLIDADNVTVLDFARASVGGRYLDVARMYTQLSFLTAKPKFSQHVIESLQAGLLSGFETALTPDCPLFALSCLQHTVTHFTRLSLNPGGGAARLYNWHVRRQHRKWLARFAAGVLKPVVAREAV